MRNLLVAWIAPHQVKCNPGVALLEKDARDTSAAVITLQDIEAARKRIAGSVYLSPCAYSETLSRATGTTLWLKLENLQMTGSFKERGACNRLAAMSPAERARGVVCASAGNHALGVAYHAQRLGIDATVVMPEVAPLVKVTNTRNFGARVVLYGATFEEAFEKAKEIEASEHRIFVHAFEDELIMAGQGTIGLELLEQNPYLDVVAVAVGGGGLAAGIAIAMRETNPRIKVYGVETSVLPSMKAAFAAGAPVIVPAARTIAEGIAVRRAGDMTYEACKKHLDDIVLVDEEEIAEAILTLLEREKTVAEGAGAAALAALLHKRIPSILGKKVAAVVCGGNIDVNVISRIIERGLVKSGRMVRLHVTISDATGSLARFTRVLADAKANVVQIHHDRAFGAAELNETGIEVVLETRGVDHIEQVRAALLASGYRLQE
jgi:threonine dehydratase